MEYARRRSGGRLRLMAVHAHPDDESSKGGATLARYAAEGVQVLVVSCTGGERGMILNPRLYGRPEIRENMAHVRRQEMRQAQRILGVDHAWLGFIDSGVPRNGQLPAGCFARCDLPVPVAALVGQIRRFRPHVITTYGENGGYPHPDHVMAHQVTVAAFDAAADPNRYPEAGGHWQPLKLYYDRAFSLARARAEDQTMRRLGLTRSHPAWVEHYGPPGQEFTTRVRCEDWFEVRDRALQAHATQVDPDGEWFAVPAEVRRQAWPTEEFTLARSLVRSPLPEEDLFAGVAPDGEQPPQPAVTSRGDRASWPSPAPSGAGTREAWR